MFEELTVVKTKVRRHLGLKTFPAGSTGTIVHKFSNATAYEVEFNKPHKGVVFFMQHELEPA